MVRVFVYGSLKQRCNNHFVLEGAQCLGRYVTVPQYTMVDMGDYPAVVAGGVTAISGEVYTVSTRVFAALDVLEDYPCIYGRIMIDTDFGRAWMYVLREVGEYPRIISGDWQP